MLGRLRSIQGFIPPPTAGLLAICVIKLVELAKQLQLVPTGKDRGHERSVLVTLAAEAADQVCQHSARFSGLTQLDLNVQVSLFQFSLVGA